MSVSFIVNTEVKLAVNNKSLPKSKKGQDDKVKNYAEQKLIEFSEREIGILKKIDKLVNESPKVDENKIVESKKKDKYTKLTLSDVKKLKSDNDGLFLCDLIEISALRLELPENEIVPRNPELEERIQRLKAEQDQRQYNSMTKNVDSGRKNQPEDSIAFQMKQINRQLIAVAQFVFSVLSGFLFGFLGVELIVGNLDFGFRLLLGIICALIIALAEIYFLAKKLASEDDIIESPIKTANYQQAQAKLKTN